MLNRNKLIGKLAEQGMTQRALAERLGCTENTLSDKLNGKREFRLDEAGRICDVLGIADPGDRAAIFLSDCPKSGTEE